FYYCRLILGRISAGARNSLRLQRLEEASFRCAREPILVVSEHVKMVGISRTAWVHLRRRYAGYLLKHRGEVVCVLLAQPGLLLYPRHLFQKQTALELRHPEIEPDLRLPQRGACRASAVILECPALLVQLLVVCHDCPTLAGIQVFRPL